MSRNNLRRTLFFAALLMAAHAAMPHAADAPQTPKKEWPDVLVIDDFSTGMDQWESRGTGSIALVDDAELKKKVLLWTAPDDGVGRIVLKALDRQRIDFSQYDLLAFRVKTEGKPAWCINPVLQQYPAAYGFRAFYYSVDTLHPFGTWFDYTQDLTRWENVDAQAVAGYSSFDPERQEFLFEVTQLEGAERTRVYLTDIRLMKNPLGVKRSYPGTWARLADGSQRTHFAVDITNHKTAPIHVTLSVPQDNPGSIRRFALEFRAETILLLPGETREIAVAVTTPADALTQEKPWYGETARIAFGIAEVPGLSLTTELIAGTRPEAFSHPCILTDPERM